MPGGSSRTFDLTPDQRAALGRAALDWVLTWFTETGARPLYPTISAVDLEAALAGPCPTTGTDPQAVLQQFAALIARNSRDNGHPRMFGYVQSSGTFVGVLGDLLASALNQNVTSWRSAPAATTIERQTVRWLGQMVGAPAGADGLLVSGGSMANLVGLAAALTSAYPAVARQGVRALPGQPVVYASPLVHMSIPKAAALLGLGREAVRHVPVDDRFQIDLDALDRAIAEDTRNGRAPVCVVGNAGDVNTGAVDPLDGLADVAERHRLWFHADAAYGGFAAMAPSTAQLFRGLGRADSLSLDPHKWLFVPLDAGCVLVRDPAMLRRAFSYSADYVDVVADADMSDFAFWDYGPELSRRFRALKLWMTLKVYGTEGIAGAIEHNLRLAWRLAELVDNATDFERLAPAPLSIVCFRFVGRGGDAADLNAINRRLMLAVQRAGRAYLSNAMIGEAFALRACFVNHRTDEGDVGSLLEEIRASVP